MNTKNLVPFATQNNSAFPTKKTNRFFVAASFLNQINSLTDSNA